jgi:putative transposase
LAGDATTVTKSGAQTYGIGRFFREFARQVVSGLEFFVFSLVDVADRRAYPLAVRQTVRSEAEKAAIKERKRKRAKKAKKVKSKPKGRKKGSLNKDKNELSLSPELVRTGELLSGLRKLLRVFVRIKYVALDGHYGHHQAVLMAIENDLHLISKMRKDAALYEKYAGEYGGKGARKEVWNEVKI